MEEQHPKPEPVKTMSFTEKIVNVFASPGDLYENVQQTGPTNSNWFVPWIILVVVMIITTQLMMSNPALLDQLGMTMRNSMDKAVQNGKLTQDLADQQYRQFGPGSTLFTIIAIVGPAFVTFVTLFALGLVYWLLGKTAMSASSPFMKVVEVVGLTYLIGSLESVVTTLLMFAMNSIFATPSLALVVQDFSIENKLHVALAKVNVFTIWKLVVTGVGLAKLFQRDLAKVMVLVFALWIIWAVVTVLAGINLS
jgi:hypothetical protein